MSFQKQLKKQIDNAFKKIGDLAKTVTLLQKNNTGYDFSAKVPIETPLVTTTIQAVIKEKSSKEDTENASMKIEAIVKASDITDPDIYDKMIIDGEVWTIVKPYKTNGLISKLTLNKEN